MLTENCKKVLVPTHNFLLIMWGAFLSSICLMTLIAYLAAARAADNNIPRPLDEGILIGISIVAFATGLASLLLPRFLLSEARILSAMKREFDPAVQQGSGNVKYTEEQLANIRLLSNEERRVLTLPSLFIFSFLLRIALNDAVVIYGFALSVQSQRPEFIIPFAGAGLLLHFLSFPRYETFVEQALDLFRARGAG